MTGTPAKFIQSSKNRQILVDSSGFEYKKKLDNKDKSITYWECRAQDSHKCKATAITSNNHDEGSAMIKQIKGDHTHSSNILKKRVKEIENRFIENAAQNPTIACRTVLGELANCLQSDSLAASSSMGIMSNLKKRIYRARFVSIYLINQFTFT